MPRPKKNPDSGAPTGGKKTTRKKAEQPVEKQSGPVEEIMIQADGGEWNVADLKEAAIAAYVADKHRRGSIKKLSIYIKPDERKVYYVMNEKTEGSIDFA